MLDLCLQVVEEGERRGGQSRHAHGHSREVHAGGEAASGGQGETQSSGGLGPSTLHA